MLHEVDTRYVYPLLRFSKAQKMFSTTIDQAFFRRDPESAGACLSDLGCNIQILRSYYPNFDRWFSGKVLPGIHTGERSILLEYRNGNLAGFAITKDDGGEQKLCCLRVVDEYQNFNGMGLRLFEKAFDILKTEKPLLSVAEEKMAEYKRIFEYYDFELARKYVDIYRNGRSEFSYNGILSSPSDSPTLHSGKKAQPKLIRLS